MDYHLQMILYLKMCLSASYSHNLYRLLVIFVTYGPACNTANKVIEIPRHTLFFIVNEKKMRRIRARETHMLQYINVTSLTVSLYHTLHTKMQ